MRILHITPRPPFPPEGRETVRPYHQIRFLALHHDVDLVCFSGGGVDEWQAREQLKNLCHRVQIVPIDTPPQDPASMKNLFARRPLALRRYFRRSLLRRLKAVGESGRYDLVFVHSAAMAPYLSAFPETPKVVDLVDVGSVRWLEYAHLSRFPARAIYRAEASRLQQVELRAASLAQRTVFGSKEEAQVFRAICHWNDRICSLKTPVSPRAPLLGPWSGEPSILFAGHLDHFPNGDAAIRFLVEMLPRIRANLKRVRVTIAGKNPSGELRMLAESAGVTLVDGRHDLRELLRDAWVVVAPHRVARGVRTEILEAMAVGVPVVATHEARTGLDLIPGHDIVVESDDRRFADAVTGLLKDPVRLDQLGDRGRKSIHNNYSHWSVAIRLEEIVNQARAERLTVQEPHVAD